MGGFRLDRVRHLLDSHESLNTSSLSTSSAKQKCTRLPTWGSASTLLTRHVPGKLQSAQFHMVANLWHCPKPDDFDDFGPFAGAGTVGSAEACLLAGPCSKSRWREWCKKRHPNQDRTRYGCFVKTWFSRPASRQLGRGFYATWTSSQSWLGLRRIPSPLRRPQ